LSPKVLPTQISVTAHAAPKRRGLSHVWEALLCLCNLGAVQILLVFLGAHRTARLLLSAAHDAQARSADATAATSFVPHASTALWCRRADMLRRVAHLIPGALCLARAIAVVWWAQRSGEPARLFVGVKPGAQGISAHAWSDLHGVLLDESTAIADTFTLTAFPGASQSRSAR
jgi:hypothetical protein